MGSIPDDPNGALSGAVDQLLGYPAMARANALCRGDEVHSPSPDRVLISNFWPVAIGANVHIRSI